MHKDWKIRIARDFIALGSIPFYFFVTVMSIIGRDSIFIYRLLIAMIVLFVLLKLIKKADSYSARGFILFIFTSLHYKNIKFTIFATILWLFILISLYYLKTKRSVILKGILLGAISTLISYYLYYLAA